MHIVINGLFLDFHLRWSKSDSCTLHLYILLNSSDKITHLNLILCDVNVWKKNSHESRNCWVYKSLQYILWSMNIHLHNSKRIFYILQPSAIVIRFLTITRNVSFVDTKFSIDGITLPTTVYLLLSMAHIYAKAI